MLAVIFYRSEPTVVQFSDGDHCELWRRSCFRVNLSTCAFDAFQFFVDDALVLSLRGARPIDQDIFWQRPVIFCLPLF